MSRITGVVARRWRWLATLGVVVALVAGVALVGIQLASTIIIWSSASAAWVFVVMYHVLSRGAWARDSIGRHVMAFVAVDAVVFTLLAATMLWPMLGLMTWYQWAYVASVAGIPYTIVWRIVIAWRLFHDAVAVAGRRPEEHLPAPAAPRAESRSGVRVRLRLSRPLVVVQVGLAGVQVAVADLVARPVAGHVALLVGAVQLALGCVAYGRTTAGSPASSS